MAPRAGALHRLELARSAARCERHDASEMGKIEEAGNGWADGALAAVLGTIAAEDEIRAGEAERL
jgi:hypothetical protein